VAIVIVVIPIAIGMPAVAVFIPPAVPLVPAALTGFMQFMPRAICLPALPTVVFHGFVELMVRFGNATLATIVVFSGRSGCTRKCQHAEKRGCYEQGPAHELLLSHVNRHISSILQISPRLGWGWGPSYKTP
jgi:hypothetical protein